DFDDAKIEAAARGLDRLKNAYHNLVAAQATADGGAGAPEATLRRQLAEVKTNFEAGMDDDFNTALGLSALFDLARDVNTYLREEDHEKAALKEAQDLFDALLYVFGLDFEAPGTDDALADDLMALLIDLRAQARADKQFALADAIRDRLKDLGIVLEDGKNGTTWKQAH
ncbi:MAG: DALR domain-containing protein, partial [Peptococcus niger]